MAANNNSEKSASALHSIFYSNNPLNRMNNKRTEQKYVDDLVQNSTSVFLPFFKLRPYLTKQIDNRRDLAWLTQDQAEPALLQDKSKNRTLLFLGTLQDKAYFAFDIDEETSNKFIAQDPNKEFPDMRLAASTLKYEDAAILAQARAYFEWHARHLYCGVCGSKTESQEGGSRRKCTGCGTSLYPRTDPVAIVLVTSADGQRCLLGRKKEFPKGIYTCIAGFMEPGESMEDAVAREVKEESDIDVDVQSVDYYASQPWPFGGQLMLGCFAHAKSENINVGEGDIAQELEDARWFTREEAKEAVSAALVTDAWLKSTAGNLSQFATSCFRPLLIAVVGLSSLLKIRIFGLSLLLFLAGFNADPIAYVTSGDLLNDNGDAISRLYYIDLTTGSIQQRSDLYIQAGFDWLFDMQTGLDVGSGTFYKSNGYTSVHRYSIASSSLLATLNFPFTSIQSTTYEPALKSLIVTGTNVDGTYLLSFPSDLSGTQELAYINTTVNQFFRGITTNKGTNFYYITGNNVTDYYPAGATTYLNMFNLNNPTSVVSIPLSCQGYPLLPMYLYWSETRQLLYAISAVYPSGNPTDLSYYLHTLSITNTAQNCKLTQLRFTAASYAQVSSWAIDEVNNQIYAGVVDPDNLLCSFDMTTGQGSSTCIGLNFFISSITMFSS